MPWVLSFAGQKGGTGKSMLSQAMAVSSLQAAEQVVLMDLDVGQRTSFEWNEARKLNKILPAVDVRLIDPDRHIDFGISLLPPATSLVVVDAPGWSDEKTLALAGYSDVMVLSTGASVADLRPTIRLRHELIAKGTVASRLVTALCRVKTEGEIAFARQYLEEAGFNALPGALSELPVYRSLQNQGYCAVEARGEGVREEALQLMGSIRGALETERVRQQRKPERFTPGPERFFAPRPEDEGREDDGRDR